MPSLQPNIISAEQMPCDADGSIADAPPIFDREHICVMAAAPTMCVTNAKDEHVPRRKVLRETVFEWRWTAVSIVLGVLVLFIAPWDCPRESICVTATSACEDGFLCWRNVIEPQRLMLGVSRVTAYASYPALVLVFLSKCRHLRTFISGTSIVLVLPRFQDMHEMHVSFGHWLHLALWTHGVFHILRWAFDGTMEYLLYNMSGATGLAGVVVCSFVCLPMGCPHLRKRLTWGLRFELLHSRGALIFCVLAALHAPQTNMGYVMWTVLAIYVTDKAYDSLMSFRVDSPVFQRLNNGVVVKFKLPEGRSIGDGSYVNLCVPFVSKSEWHPFSVYPCHQQPGHACVHVQAVGDWTKELRNSLEHASRRPVWISGPFSSPFVVGAEYDNLILVATGIGITPAVATLNSFGDSRCCNLIWVCRDETLIDFYLDNVPFTDRSWCLIFYTGKEELKSRHNLPETVLIFKGRPDLRETVLTIVNDVEFCMDMEGRHAQSATIVDDAPLRQALEFALKRRTPDDIMNEIRTYGQDTGHVIAEEIKQLISALSPYSINAQRCSKIVRDLQKASPSEDHLTGRISAQLLHDFCQGYMKREVDRARTRDLAYAPVRPRVEKTKSKDQSSSSLHGQQWVLLYCGGAQPMIDSLSEISKESGIKFRQESFAW